VQNKNAIFSKPIKMILIYGGSLLKCVFKTMLHRIRVT